MGIDYFCCDNCEKSFPDCIEYFSCDCGSRFCSNECGGKQNTQDDFDDDFVYDEDPSDECDEEITYILCRKEAATHDQLLNFLLEKFNLTYEQALELYKENV